MLANPRDLSTIRKLGNAFGLNEKTLVRLAGKFFRSGRAPAHPDNYARLYILATLPSRDAARLRGYLVSIEEELKKKNVPQDEWKKVGKQIKKNLQEGRIEYRNKLLYSVFGGLYGTHC